MRYFGVLMRVYIMKGLFRCLVYLIFLRRHDLPMSLRYLYIRGGVRVLTGKTCKFKGGD